MELSARIIQLWWEDRVNYLRQPLAKRRQSTPKKMMKSLKSSPFLLQRESSDLRRMSSDSSAQANPVSRQTAERLSELYRKLYLAINALRRFHLSSVPLAVQFNSEGGSKEQTSAQIFAQTGVEEQTGVEDCTRGSVSVSKNVNKGRLRDPADDEAVSALRREVGVVRQDVASLCTCVQGVERSLDDIHSLLFALKRDVADNKRGVAEDRAASSSRLEAVSTTRGQGNAPHGRRGSSPIIRDILPDRLPDVQSRGGAGEGGRGGRGKGSGKARGLDRKGRERSRSAHRGEGSPPSRLPSE
jgi:hypothetical protein